MGQRTVLFRPLRDARWSYSVNKAASFLPCVYARGFITYRAAGQSGHGLNVERSLQVKLGLLGHVCLAWRVWAVCSSIWEITVGPRYSLSNCCPRPAPAFGAWLQLVLQLGRPPHYQKLQPAQGCTHWRRLRSALNLKATRYSPSLGWRLDCQPSIKLARKLLQSTTGIASHSIEQPPHA